MSPEYAMRGHYSIKSDVFSFGVLILEIVTGRRNCGSYSFEDDSTDLLSLVSASSLPNSMVYIQQLKILHLYNTDFDTIRSFGISNSGVGELDGRNTDGDHGSILEQPRSTRPDGEVHPDRPPVRSGRPHG
jgi:hypothetical protein